MANKSKSKSPFRSETAARWMQDPVSNSRASEKCTKVLIMFCQFSCFGSSHTGFKTWILILV